MPLVAIRPTTANPAATAPRRPRFGRCAAHVDSYTYYPLQATMMPARCTAKLRQATGDASAGDWPVQPLRYAQLIPLHGVH
ncbi:unnamed protein product [Urochloa humidicola]